MPTLDADFLLRLAADGDLSGNGLRIALAVALLGPIRQADLAPRLDMHPQRVSEAVIAARRTGWVSVIAEAREGGGRAAHLLAPARA
ncbi:hypothetical protein [Azospirillum argentinense]|uniref:MarR family transcriptional regulator n=1 Tax=Azospirillum brasilense TaxID=192 RepID=A0A4D8QCI2_AZOBR|nr:hypothetical protein [Azospirillum argentinense]QCO07444.1 hypothetical protein D3867_36790 [Azospirillum argentinense]